MLMSQKCADAFGDAGPSDKGEGCCDGHPQTLAECTSPLDGPGTVSLAESIERLDHATTITTRARALLSDHTPLRWDEMSKGFDFSMEPSRLIVLLLARSTLPTLR